MRYKSFDLQEISTKKTINFCSSSFSYCSLFLVQNPVSNILVSGLKVFVLIVLALCSMLFVLCYLLFVLCSLLFVLCSLLFALYSLLYILHRKIAFQLFQRIFAGLYIPNNLSLFEYHGAAADFGDVVEVVAGDEHSHVVLLLQFIEQSFQADL